MKKYIYLITCILFLNICCCYSEIILSGSSNSTENCKKKGEDEDSILYVTAYAIVSLSITYLYLAVPYALMRNLYEMVTGNTTITYSKNGNVQEIPDLRKKMRIGMAALHDKESVIKLYEKSQKQQNNIEKYKNYFIPEKLTLFNLTTKLAKGAYSSSQEGGHINSITKQIVESVKEINTNISNYLTTE